MQKSLITVKKSNEWLEFISRLGMVSIDQARAVFLSGDYTQLPDIGQKALYTAGRGKTLSLEGNLIGAKMTLDEAQLLAEMRNAEKGYLAKDEILAYINFERGVFFEKYGEMFNGLSLLRSAKRLAETDNLEAIIDYKLSSLNLQNKSGGSVSEVRSWINHFSENQMEVMQLLAMRFLANHHRLSKAYPKAEHLLMEALDLSTDFNYPFIIEQIKNSYGYLQYDMGELHEAKTIFETLLKGIQSNYLKATVLENLTLTHHAQTEYDTAAGYLGEAITHCQKYEVLSLIPDQCLFMGDLQREKLQHPELATYYYDIGSQVSLKMAEYGFTLQGDRLKVIKRFQNRPKVGYSLPDKLGEKADPFAFSVGKTWRDINDVFQYHLIRNHLKSKQDISDLPGKLGLKSSTYYAIKRRLTKNGLSYDGTNPGLFSQYRKKDIVALKSYVMNFLELTWSDANQRFEREVIEYLFKLAGYQKTRLAEELNVSYPTVLQKTKSLTRS